jgi:hypothetical protein
MQPRRRAETLGGTSTTGREAEVTARSDFDEAQWDLIVEGPTTAAMIVIRAEGGGTFRETIALAHAYADARKQHGQSELLDEIVSSKPEFNRRRYGTDTELREKGLARIGEAIAALRGASTPREVDDYGSFLVTIAERIAAAHAEHGRDISPAEQAAIDSIRARVEDAGTSEPTGRAKGASE